MGTRLGTVLGTQLGTALGTDLGGSGAPTVPTFYTGSGFTTSDFMSVSSVANGLLGSATTGLWFCIPLWFNIVPNSGTAYFSAKLSGVTGHFLRASGAALQFGVNAGSQVAPQYTVVAGDLNKAQLAVCQWDPVAQLVQLYFKRVQVGAGTAAAAYAPDTATRFGFAIRPLPLGPLPAGSEIGGFAGGNYSLTLAEVEGLFDSFKATGITPSVPGKTDVYNDVGTQQAGSWPSTLIDTIGSGTLTFQAGSAAAITLNSHTSPTYGW
jgi:hypothetical protein